MSIELQKVQRDLAEERERTAMLTREMAFLIAALTASERIRHELVNDLAVAEVRRIRRASS